MKRKFLIDGYGFIKAEEVDALPEIEITPDQLPEELDKRERTGWSALRNEIIELDLNRIISFYGEGNVAHLTIYELTYFDYEEFTELDDEEKIECSIKDFIKYKFIYIEED